MLNKLIYDSIKSASLTVFEGYGLFFNLINGERCIEGSIILNNGCIIVIFLIITIFCKIGGLV